MFGGQLGLQQGGKGGPPLLQAQMGVKGGMPSFQNRPLQMPGLGKGAAAMLHQTQGYGLDSMMQNPRPGMSAFGGHQPQTAQFRGPYAGGARPMNGLPSGLIPNATGLPPGLIPAPPSGPRAAFANPMARQSAAVLPSLTSKQLASYAKKLKAIYSAHSPDKVEKVDYLLQKYKGQEDYLIQSVCTKYCVDPDNLEESLGLEKGSLDVVENDEEVEPAEEPSVPREKRTVMEWDSAKGAMVETTVEVDAVTGMTEDEKLQKEILTALGQEEDSGAGTTNIMTPSGSLPPSADAEAPSVDVLPSAGGDAQGEDADDDEYDPFNTAPATAEGGEESVAIARDAVAGEASQKSDEVPMPPDVQELVDIDFILLGESSEFFERGLLGEQWMENKRRRLAA